MRDYVFNKIIKEWEYNVEAEDLLEQVFYVYDLRGKLFHDGSDYAKKLLEKIDRHFEINEYE